MQSIYRHECFNQGAFLSLNKMILCDSYGLLIFSSLPAINIWWWWVFLYGNIIWLEKDQVQIEFSFAKLVTHIPSEYLGKVRVIAAVEVVLNVL